MQSHQIRGKDTSSTWYWICLILHKKFHPPL